jgi:hypothetical protein
MEADMPAKHVTIDIHQGSLRVIPPVVEVFGHTLDTIVWETRPLGNPFLVCFGAKSPFGRSHFDHTNPASGPIVTLEESVYKYTVEFQGQVLDPGVVIKP